MMKFLIVFAIAAMVHPLAMASELSLERAVEQALETDQWLIGNRLRESALREESVRAGSLPDPTLSFGVANLPTDSWDFDQENMTQFRVGVTQRFPGGDSLAAKARKNNLIADLSPLQRQNRKAQLTERVSQLWLDAYLAKYSINLIERERHLFEQLIDVTIARYRSAAGNARQQDVIRAQLELTSLEDRLSRLHQQYDISRQMLAQWLPADELNKPLPAALPSIAVPTYLSNVDIAVAIKRHPQLLAVDKQIAVEQASVDLAREDYKPGWALNAVYGYRDDAPNGMKREDFFSLGVSVDLPLFTKNRQDRSLSAARSRQQAMSMDYQLLERQLLSQAYKTQSELMRLTERSYLYEQTLLQQMNEQAKASLSAYTNDDGDFADVMRAYISELNSKIAALEINVNHRKAAATMNYLLAGISANEAELQTSNHFQSGFQYE